MIEVLNKPVIVYGFRGFTMRFAGRFLSLLFICLLAGVSTFSQYKSQEISEEDGVPVLVKHLPQWESVASKAVITNIASELSNIVGPRPVLDLVSFEGGTEAVTARYPAGQLVIVEFTTPQASIDTDRRVVANLTAAEPNPSIVYRRIGNYNAFVFDVNDAAAANALLDEIKYEKVVQWLGEDPNAAQKAERFFAIRAADIFISTVLVIVGGIAVSVLAGVGIGFFYFRMRDQKRGQMRAFSDAGGMTRLNLDELSETDGV